LESAVASNERKRERHERFKSMQTRVHLNSFTNVITLVKLHREISRKDKKRSLR